MSRKYDYLPPFSGAAPQTARELARVHPRWIKKLMANLPEGVPLDAHQKERWNADWPETERGEYVRQCGFCCYYITLEGSLGSDWGACSHRKSQYDGRVVFEHWTCAHWKTLPLPDNFDEDRWHRDRALTELHAIDGTSASEPPSGKGAPHHD